MHKMQTRKLLYVAIGLSLLVVVIYSICVNLRPAYEQTPSLSFPTSSQSTKNTTTSAKKSSSSTSLPATKSYLDALKIYKTSGYYFQFVDCHGSPGSFTLKAGKKFMLDNRDPVARKIAITGVQTFNIRAYNFAIATAPSIPGDYYITCNGGGAAKIIVQK
jgi:hypothetical protein